MARFTPPILYRAVFLIFDLFLPLFGVYAHVLQPDLVLSGFTSNFAKTPAVETQILLDALAGFFFGLAILHLWLLTSRHASFPVWRVVQINLIATDIFMLFAFYRSMKTEGRLDDIKSWRNEDFGNIVGYLFLTLVRTLFVTGFGVTKHLSKDKKHL